MAGTAMILQLLAACLLAGGPGDGVDWDAAGRDTVETLRFLIRFRTVNPPGDEIGLARALADRLGKDGIPAEAIEPAAGRGDLIARLRP